MKVSSSIQRRRCQHCRIVLRNGRVYRICSKMKRHKGRQG